MCWAWGSCLEGEGEKEGREGKKGEEGEGRAVGVGQKDHRSFQHPWGQLEHQSYLITKRHVPLSL